MKHLLLIFVITLVLALSSCSIVSFDRLEDHKGSIILKIEDDKVGTIDVQRFFIKDVNHKIHELTIRPEIGQFYAVKDTLR